MAAYEAFDLRPGHTQNKTGFERSAVKLPTLQVVRERRKCRRQALASHEALLTRNTTTRDVPVHPKKLVILICFLALVFFLGIYPFL